MARATRFISSLQRSDGSVGGSAVETALILLGLADVPTSAAEPDKARPWLSQRVVNGVPSGEPILHYWFDDPRLGRSFFVCSDRGGLVESLARHALKVTARSNRAR